MSTSLVPTRAHPLELIGPLRRWPPSPLRNLVYTALLNCLIGIGITLGAGLVNGRLPPAGFLGEMVLTANLIGFAIHLGLFATRRLLPAARPGERSPLHAVSAVLLYLCCAAFGILVAEALVGRAGTLRAMLGNLWAWLPAVLATGLAVHLLLSAAERRMARERDALRQQEQIAQAGRLLAEARLRALQAQIEPHFLYNTLANVVGLIGADPARARHMLERLIDFLRASLAASRAEASTLGAEIDQACAYLDVLAVRMGARLRYRVEADSACRALPLAPMLLQPLVENAVMHGIEPKVGGGEILIRARRADGLLVLEVIDDGNGLAPGALPRPGGGVGLANLRERLGSLHGPGARLQLLENEAAGVAAGAAAGVTARLLLPLPPAAH